MSQRRLGLELSRADLRLLADYRVFLERKGLRRSSIVSFIYKLRLFAEHVFPRDLLSATSEDVDAFADAPQLGARARYLYISTIHGLYHWAVIYGRAKRDPTLRVVRPRWPRSIPRPIPDGDLRRLIAAAPQRELAMIALAAFHGLRAAEIAGLQREDILELNSPPVLIVSEGKGGHQRVLPLHVEGWEMIRPVTHGVCGYLFKPYNVSHAVNELLEALDVEASCHSLRHWCGSKVYGASKDLRVTQALMGHASPNTTVGYVAFSSQDAHEAVAAITHRQEAIS